MSIPIYISLTSIYQNQSDLLKTLKSIENQSVQPSKIYVYLSEESYLIDIGFKERKITNVLLSEYISTHNIIVLWVPNTGPYRKLLPLLKEMWNKDCLIITIDDDTEYDSKLIENLYNDYILHNCVVNYRGFTPFCTNIQTLSYDNRCSSIINRSLYNFPTGKGGILYHPSFFYKTGDIIFNEALYKKACPTNDDVWFVFMRIYNNIDCYLDNKPYMSRDNTKAKLALFHNYNSKNNLNNKYIKACLELLQGRL